MNYLLQLEGTGTELLLTGHGLGIGIKDGGMETAPDSTSSAGTGTTPPPAPLVLLQSPAEPE